VSGYIYKVYQLFDVSKFKG